jgi:DNA-binding response OmpR family regulator/S1-C subfamily serine protease
VPPTTENLVVLAEDALEREKLRLLLAGAGYEVTAAKSVEESLAILRSKSVDVLVVSGELADSGFDAALATIKSTRLGARTRVVLLSNGDSEQRARALDQGVDDIVPLPYEERELQARVRAQLREKRAVQELESKLQIAEESREVAQTAFQALAVTEKMTRDAFSLERILKIGVAALLGIALVIAAIFFLYSHRAEKETRRAYKEIAQLERSVLTEQQLLTSARRLRDDPKNSDVLQQKEQLTQQAETLRQKLAAENGSDREALRHQLEEATGRLSKIEGESQAAENVIRAYAPSVCLLHVSVAFNDKESGRRLRYGGMDSDGSPLKDSEGNPVYTTEGRGPEVRGDFFGTGFIAGDGKILTNHHVVQPWWQNEELNAAIQQGLEPVIGEMTAYFPGASSGISVGISQISQGADLAVVHGDLSDLQRPALKLDNRKEAAVSGAALISVGYATGLDAILARAGEETVQQIVKTSGGEPKLVLAELAKRKLIRPLVTQGHVGDVLPDKIVYDAQTTSGGSGGPLLNREGGVIGVTFAIVRGFGGSNFGVPIRFANPLLKH